MSYIQIDARGCGAGKTRNTIVPRIKNNTRLGINTLVVVPSKRLQEEYATHFPADEITIINSDRGRILEQYQTTRTAIKVITHQGFLQTPTEYFDKSNTDLIIDEALDPYAMEIFSTSDSAGRTWVDFSQVFAWRDLSLVPDFKPVTKTQEFYELTVIQSTPPDIINTEKWRRIANPNWRLWATWQTGENLINNHNETAAIQMELKDSVLDHWSSVWIAAAAFEKTFMGYWMRANDIPYEIEYPFEKHQARINWHMPTEEFRWSKGCREANPEILKQFIQYAETNRTGRLIYNKNNDSDTEFIGGDRIPHNAHGRNEYRDRIDYAFMSAIQPTAIYKNFLQQKTQQESEQLTFAFSGYTAYQLIMRTAVRDPNNTLTVNVFALDTEMIRGVMDLFDSKLYNYFTAIPVMDQRQKKTSRAMTNAEKQRLYRLRKQTANP